MKINYKCQICEKECADGNGLASHINRKRKNPNDIHSSWTVEKYIDTFVREPEDVCPQCGKPIYISLGGRKFTYCSYSCKFKYEQNEKVKNGIPVAMQNKESVEKAKATRREKHNGKWCSEEGQRICNIGAWNEQAIENRIKTHREHFGCDYPFQNKEYYEKRMDEFEKKHGVRNPSQSKEIMDKAKRKYKYDGINFDSSWEIAYYIFLRDFKIEFEYHPKEVPFVCNGVTHYTIIDFLVEGQYVEIKGDHLRNKDGSFKNLYGEDQSLVIAKQKKLEELNTVIMSKKEIKPYLNYVKLNYGFNYLTQFRV